jgi:hypothetical protein
MTRSRNWAAMLKEILNVTRIFREESTATRLTVYSTLFSVIAALGAIIATIVQLLDHH